MKRLTQEERNKVHDLQCMCTHIVTHCRTLWYICTTMDDVQFTYMYIVHCITYIHIHFSYLLTNSQSLNGSVELAADEEFTKHQWEGSGLGGKKKEEQEWNIPGNAVHYKVTLNKSEEQDQKKVWSFKVSGLQKGRLELICTCS